MAVVGEARIVVKAITTGVGPEIKRALDAAAGDVNKSGEKLGKELSNGLKRGAGKGGDSPFSKLEKDAIKAREAFSNLQRTGFAMQAGLGSLAGTIGSIVGALGALISAAGAAAPSLVAVAGAGIGLGLGMKLAGMALKGVTAPLQAVGKSASGTWKTVKQLREEMQQLKFDSEDAALSEKEAALNLEKARNNLARVQDLPPNNMARREAELAYQQADLSLRRAIDRNNDLKDQIKNGPVQGPGAGGVDPYKGLTDSQKAFAKLLVGLKPKFDQLKEAVAKGFLPALGDGIKKLMNDDFPVLLKGFTRIGTALGKATGKIFDMLDAAAKSGTMTSLFETSAVVIERLGDAVAQVFGAVLTILQAASPITVTFVGWIDSLATKFKTFIDKAAGDGSLKKFFEDSSKFASGFGEVFGNIFSGLGAIIMDAFKPGSGASILLDWLKKATSGFANIGKDGNLHSFLADSATNTTKMLDVLGKVGGMLVRLGGDKNVGKMWDTLGQAVPYLEKILSDGNKAGPAFADLVVQVMRLISAFSDNKTLEVFFNTLKDMAKGLADFFNEPNVKGFMDAMSQVHGWLLAVGLAAIIGKKVLMIMLGSVLKLFGPFNYFFKTNKKGLSQWDKDWKSAKDTFANFKKTMVGGFNAIKNGVSNAFNAVKSFASQAWTDLKQGVTLWKDAAVEKFKVFKEAAGKAFNTFKENSIKAFDALKSKASTVFTSIGTWTKNVGSKLAGFGKSVMGAAGKAGSAIAGLAGKLAVGTVAVYKNVAAWVAQKAALIGSAIASAAMKVAQVAQNVVTAIATGVQTAFNAVMAVNPIVWIILAIVALIAALVWFFTQTEVGKKAWQAFMDFLIGLWNGIVAVVQSVVQWIIDAWNGLVAGITAVFQFIWGLIQAYINMWIGIFKFAIGIIVGVWNGLVAGIGAAINWVVGIFKGAWNGVVSFFKGLVNGLIGMFESFVNFVINGLNNFMRPLRDAINGILTTLGVKFQFSVIPNVHIPRLAKGGVVSPSAGGSLVNVAEAGKPERIEPLDENGMSKRDKAMLEMVSRGSGVNINVHPSKGMDETEVASLVSRRLAFELRKGATG